MNEPKLEQVIDGLKWFVEQMEVRKLVTVTPLAWEKSRMSEPDDKWHSTGPFLYTITRYFSEWGEYRWDRDERTGFGHAETLEAAQAAAQADYEARILSALSASPKQGQGVGDGMVALKNGGRGKPTLAVLTVYDWAYLDAGGDEHYARTPEKAKALQAAGVKLTPVYTIEEPAEAAALPAQPVTLPEGMVLVRKGDLAVALEGIRCPRPASGRPSDDTAEACHRDGICGCVYGTLLALSASQGTKQNG